MINVSLAAFLFSKNLLFIFCCCHDKRNSREFAFVGDVNDLLAKTRSESEKTRNAETKAEKETCCFSVSSHIKLLLDVVHLHRYNPLVCSSPPSSQDLVLVVHVRLPLSFLLEQKLGSFTL